MSVTPKTKSPKGLTARVRSRNQVTLPHPAIAATGLSEGAFLTVTVSTKRTTVEPGVIILAPQELAPRVWSKADWEREEEAVDREIKSSKLSRKYKGAKAVITALKKK